MALRALDASYRLGKPLVGPDVLCKDGRQRFGRLHLETYITREGRLLARYRHRFYSSNTHRCVETTEWQVRFVTLDELNWLRVINGLEEIFITFAPPKIHTPRKLKKLLKRPLHALSAKQRRRACGFMYAHHN